MLMLVLAVAFRSDDELKRLELELVTICVLPILASLLSNLGLARNVTVWISCRAEMSMLPSSKGDGPRPRCLVTNATLPNFVNHEQPPTKKRPFSTLLNQTFTHRVRQI